MLLPYDAAYIPVFSQEKACQVQEGLGVQEWGSRGSEDGQFEIPHSIAFDSLANVYVTDTNNDRAQKFTSNGTFITRWGSKGSGDGQLNEPHSSAIDSLSNVYVSDMNNYRIQKFDGNGIFITKWGSQGSGDGQFIALDSFDNVYVDQGKSDIQKFDNNGTFLKKWGGEETEDFEELEDLELDCKGILYVTDKRDSLIKKIPNGL